MGHNKNMNTQTQFHTQCLTAGEWNTIGSYPTSEKAIKAARYMSSLPRYTSREVRVVVETEYGIHQVIFLDGKRIN